jgi:hypothetical protein
VKRSLAFEKDAWAVWNGCTPWICASTVLQWCDVGLTCDVWQCVMNEVNQHTSECSEMIVMFVFDGQRQHTAQQTVA